MDIQWDDLRFLIALARNGSFLRAGRDLKVEHTTVARRIQRMEGACGVTLLRRTPKGLIFTPDGQHVLRHALKVEKDVTRLERMLEARSSRPDREVKVAAIESLASSWLGPHLTRFSLIYPNIRLRVNTDPGVSNVPSGEVDLAIRAIKPELKDLVMTRLGQVGFGLYATGPLAKRAEAAISDGPREPVPLLSFSEGYEHLQGARWFLGMRDRFIPILRTTSTLMLLEAARAGAGVAVLPRFMAESAGNLVRIGTRDVSNVPVWLVSHPVSRQNPNVRATAKFLIDAAKGKNGLF